MGTCMGYVASKTVSLNDTAQNIMSSCMGRQSDELDVELVTKASDTARKNVIYRIWNFKRKRKSQSLDDFWLQESTNYAKLNNCNIESNSDIQLQNLDVNLLIQPDQNEETAVNESPSIATFSRVSSSLDLEWEHEYSHIRQYEQQLKKQETLFEEAEAQINIVISNTVKDNETKAADKSWVLMDHDDDDHSISSLSSVSAKESSSGSNERKDDLNDSWVIPSYDEFKFDSIERNESQSSIQSAAQSLEWDIDEDQRQQLKMEDDNLDHGTLKLLYQIELMKNLVLGETGESLRNVHVDTGELDDVGNIQFATTTQTLNNSKCFQLCDSDGENANYS